MKHTFYSRLLALGLMLLLGSMASAQGRIERLYDDDGDYLEVREFSRDDTTKLVRTDHYVYARGGALAAIVFYKYSQENGQVESHGVCQVRKDHTVSMVEYSADEILLTKARYRYDRYGRSKGYKVTVYHEDGTTSTTKDVCRFKKNHCYMKVYIDGKFAYAQDWDCPREQAVKLKHSR